MQPFRAVEPQIIEDGLDRTNAALLRRRFLQVNQARLQRMHSAQSHRQQQCLAVLPLLFHCNHPVLPGFVSHSTPAGVSGYKPDKEDLARAKALARSFCLTSTHPGEDIWGIYLMGSTGTLAHSRHSDFDLWLCHKPGLSRAARQELQMKCDRICEWARSLRLDMHFFLMDSEAFKAGAALRLDAESSGSAQQSLLLDEFYRTALYLAGRVPLWWFVPPAATPAYSSYGKQLLERRFVRPAGVLDFGGLQVIPAGEFLGAGLWQIYKAIDSPYKSVLKLLLLEAYVSDYPAIRPLAQDFKQLIFQGELQVDNLDPYLLVYRRIESYLQSTGDAERLELARRCLYYKVNIALSGKRPTRLKSWQRQALEALVQEWGWENAHISWLDQRLQWKSPEVQRERARLVHALNQSYKLLHRFAKHTGVANAISVTEMHVLGRKLHAAFGRRPDKIDRINPGISQDLSELTLRLCSVARADEQSSLDWQLESGSPETPNLLYRAEGASALLLWSHINGLIGKHTHLDLHQAPQLDAIKVRRLLTRLRHWLPLPDAGATHEAFTRPAEPLRVLILLNVTSTEQDYAHPAAHIQVGEDPLSYGPNKRNLVHGLDLIVENSWREISCQHFLGDNALLQALKAYTDLCVPGSHQAPPELSLECLGSAHAKQIKQRVHQWFMDIIRYYYSGSHPASARYLFQLAGNLYYLQFQGPKLLVQPLNGLQELMLHLALAQPFYSPLLIDSRALPDHPLNAIARVAHSRATCVFYQRAKGELRVWLVDEMGSLTEAHYGQHQALPVLAALHSCLRGALADHPRPSGASDCGVQSIQFWELAQDELGRWRSAQRFIAPQPPGSNSALAATVSQDNQGQLRYSFSWNAQVFSWEDHGGGALAALCQARAQAGSGANLPLVSRLDLRLSAGPDFEAQPWRISHYLPLKRELELKLANIQAGT